MQIFSYVSCVRSVFPQFPISFKQYVWIKFIHLDTQWYPVNLLLKQCIVHLWEYAMFCLAASLTVDM